VSEAVDEAARPAVVIQPTKGWAGLGLRGLWEFRELLYFLVWRDVKVRYKQTALGAAWAILQPLLTMVVFNIFFHRLANVPSEPGIPYPIFSYAALLPWQYFSTALAASAGSLLSSASLIRKVYFPRITVPIAGALGGLVDFCFAFLVLIGLMAWYRVVPTPAIVLLPLFLLLAVLTAVGIGLWLSALSVQYRDVRYVVPFLMQFWLFATPVAYPSSLLSEPWRTIYGLNPMVGVVEGFRWALLGTNPPQATIFLSAIVTLLLFVSGLLFFQRTERKFADVI
jgi:lipopolysaccharide transport system permease protein